MPRSVSLQQKAHEQLLALTAGSLDRDGIALSHLPEDFKQQASEIIVIERPRLVSRTPTSNDRVAIDMRVEMLFMRRFKPHSEGHQDGMESVDLMRDGFIALVENQAGNGLLNLGAFSAQHTWEFDADYYMAGNNMIGSRCTLQLTLTRPRNHAVFEIPDPE